MGDVIIQKKNPQTIIYPLRHSVRRTSKPISKTRRSSTHCAHRLYMEVNLASASVALNAHHRHLQNHNAESVPPYVYLVLRPLYGLPSILFDLPSHFYEVS